MSEKLFKKSEAGTAAYENVEAFAVAPVVRTAAQGIPFSVVPANYASLEVVLQDLPTDGLTFIVDDGVAPETYVFADTPSGPFDVQIGLDLSATLINLADSIISNSSLIDPAITGLTDLTITSKIEGTVGNSILITGTAQIYPQENLVGGTDEYSTADPVPEAVGQECIVGDSNTGNGNYLVFKALSATTWTLSGPSGVIEDADNAGLFRRIIMDGGALSSEPYTITA